MVKSDWVLVEGTSVIYNNNFQMSVSCVYHLPTARQSPSCDLNLLATIDTPINVFQASDNTDTIGTKQYKLQM